jgi:tRNA (cytidine/uridine-2'-O-)-methyltransferase
MLPNHRIKIVLVEPEIPQNTGNVARLCAATGAALHLVRPLGFFLTDKYLKRAGMDYLERVEMTVHDDLEALLRVVGEEPVLLTSGLGGRSHWEVGYTRDVWIFFGKETAGLPAGLLDLYPERRVRIPMVEGTRGLNLATSVGVVLYEGLRQVGVGEGQWDKGTR